MSRLISMESKFFRRTIPEKSRSGAVGSALRSGRRGRVFESRLLDKMGIKRCPFLFRRLESRVFLSYFVRMIIASQFPSHVFSTSSDLDEKSKSLFVCPFGIHFVVMVA